MSTNAGAYDTSRMYRSGSHLLKDDEAAAPTPAMEADRMAEAANAILACGEYVVTAPQAPSDQGAAVALRQEIRTLVCGLSLLTAARAAGHRIE